MDAGLGMDVGTGIGTLTGIGIGVDFGTGVGTGASVGTITGVGSGAMGAFVVVVDCACCMVKVMVLLSPDPPVGRLIVAVSTCLPMPSCVQLWKS